MKTTMDIYGKFNLNLLFLNSIENSRLSTQEDHRDKLILEKIQTPVTDKRLLENVFEAGGWGVAHGMGVL